MDLQSGRASLLESGQVRASGIGVGGANPIAKQPVDFRANSFDQTACLSGDPGLRNPRDTDPFAEELKGNSIVRTDPPCEAGVTNVVGQANAIEAFKRLTVDRSWSQQQIREIGRAWNRIKTQASQDAEKEKLE